MKLHVLSSPAVGHYDTAKTIVLTTHATEYGVGSILSHMGDGKDQPMTSRTLLIAERNYSQLDKEALAVAHMVSNM